MPLQFVFTFQGKSQPPLFTGRAVNFIIFDVWFTISNENEIGSHTHARTHYTHTLPHRRPGCDEYRLLIAKENRVGINGATPTAVALVSIRRCFAANLTTVSPSALAAMRHPHSQENTHTRTRRNECVWVCIRSAL